MRFAAILGGLLIGAVLASAAPVDAPMKRAVLSSVQLISVSRLKPVDQKAPVDGLTFHFLVLRKSVASSFALTETRDFLIGGESYQAKTRKVLGKNYEPSTEVHDADKFFQRNPEFAKFARDGYAGTIVMVVAISGAEIPAGAEVEVTAMVGSGKQIEPFNFRTTVPGK